MITITVNGDSRNLSEGTNVQQLLDILAVATGRLAVEVNGEIVPRSTFSEHVLRADDSVEIVQAIGGG